MIIFQNFISRHENFKSRDSSSTRNLFTLILPSAEYYSHISLLGILGTGTNFWLYEPREVIRLYVTI